MATMGIYEARTRWSELIGRVAQGEHFTITRHGIPIADLLPSKAHQHRPLPEVFAKMRAARKGRRLEGISLRDLIREGQRY
jgi:prevent-host-death family protein